MRAYIYIYMHMSLATKVLLHNWQDYILLSNQKKRALKKKTKTRTNIFVA